MAPKKGGKDKGKDKGGDDATPAAHATNANQPQNKEEVLAQINLEGLPHCPTEQIIEIVKDKYEQLVAVFIHYCKQSECKTLEQATRLRLAGFKKLIKDANLELKVYDMEQMSRLFMTTGGAKGVGSAMDETLSLGVEQFLTLMIKLAFGRDNPRYVAAKESKKEETVPVLQCVQNLMNEFLPRMQKGNAEEFRVALKGDGEAQSVIGSYSEKIDAWIKKLAEKAEKSNSDVFTQYIAFLEEKGCLGTKSIETTEASGLQVTHKSSLTDLQARHAFLDTQDPEALAVGKPDYHIDKVMEALARCGDAKYNSIVQMSFAARVRSMVQNVLGQATEMEVITEAVASEASEGAADFDEKVKEAQRKNWLICWKNMTFKDLHGFPLWETQLHDVLQAAFPELQSIFLHYCGSSVQGSDTIGNATKIGKHSRTAHACTPHHHYPPSPSSPSPLTLTPPPFHTQA